MKTLTAPATAQSKMRGIDARCLVTVAFADGLTIRVSDQSIAAAPDGNDYLGLLTELPEVVGGFDDLEKTNEPRELRLTFANAKRVDAYARFSDLLISHPIAFATVTIKWWMKGADAEADLITDFVGQAEEAGSIRADRVEVIVSGIEMAQRNPLPLYKINTTDFPNADPQAIGRVMGPVFGTVEDVPVYPVDVGARDLLRVYITSVSTGPLELSDASRFPSSGTIIVGQEEIAYTGKNGNDLTGLSRAQNSTTAVFHNRGASVIEKKTEYTYLGPTFPMKTVNRVRVAGTALGPGEYTLDLKDTSLLPGFSVVSIKLNTPAIIHRHQHETAETTDNEKPGTAVAPPANGTGVGWADPGNAIDLGVDDETTFSFGNRAQVGNLPAGVYAELQLSNWTLADSGEIVSATYHCNYQYEEDNYIINQNDAYIDGDRISPKAAITEKVWAGPTSWAALDRTVICKIRPDTGFGLRIYDLWLVVVYVVTVAGAPAGADAVVSTPVTIDGDGVYDSLECTGLADGAITGTALTLIERPDHVMEFVQRVLAGRTAAEIDSTSYAASGSTYATNGWNFAGTLVREWRAGELLAQLALEAQSDQFWEAASGGAVHKLLYDDPSPTAVDVTVVDGDMIGEVELALTPRDSIVNIVEAHFERNYNEAGSVGLGGALGGSISGEVFLGLARKEDATSKTSYGSRPASFDLEFVRAQTLADSVSQRLLDKLKEPRWLARVPLSWTKAAALERGDLIDLNIALFSTMGTRPKFKVVNISRSFQEEAWEVEAVEVN